MVYLISGRKMGVRWRQLWSWLPLETRLNCWEWTGGRHCLTWPTLSEDRPWKQDNLFWARERETFWFQDRVGKQSYETSHLRWDLMEVGVVWLGRGSTLNRTALNRRHFWVDWKKFVETKELENELRRVQVHGDFLKVNNCQRHQQPVQWIQTNFSAELFILLF